ncbi:vitamin B12 ABC transporter permease BtuC [Vibrio hippocampi]|uniref:Vitamin B12 import system permease protein BtuC n=1 Tax=Vibrio hippocampi TaxID=654686 RepID=A0ABM8ZHY8_9VIBR|nr:vitamin B12 ABC transporter permease BtuC [Vibrio hippocampi]CAH0526116.1 Vitamin B12 import system permease protein BtuC [Vibrio hippocampi]
MDFDQLLSKNQSRWRWILVLASLLLIICSLAHLAIGEHIVNPFFPSSPLDQLLVYELRAPRLVAALVIGAALAISGATLQVLLSNVLAEPGVLGISGGASLGMVIVMFAIPAAATPLGFMSAAVVGALCFTLLLVSATRTLRLSTTRLLLVGVALGILSGAMVTWAFYFSDDLSMRQLMYWLMGSLGGLDWYQHILSLFMLPIMVWLCWQGTLLDKLMIGEVHAKQLGVDVAKIRWQLILAISILVGCSVALAGVISFVGLVIPHLLRLAFGTENRYLLPLSAIAGATLLVLSDIFARTLLSSAELPIGVMTTTIGAPIFIWMLVKNHDTGS